MKTKTLLALCALALVIPAAASAEIADLQIYGDAGTTAALRHGGRYKLTWSDDAPSRLTHHSAWLTGGKITAPIYLGETPDGKTSYTFTLPSNMDPATGYYIQLSGWGAEGEKVGPLRIEKGGKASAPKSKAKAAVSLEEPSGGILIAGEKNIVRWSGGSEIVQIGLETGSGKLLGWIKTDAKPKGQLTWTAERVCDIAMSVCWEVPSLSGETSYRIVAVSKDADDNLTLDGNVDRSEKIFRISSDANVPGKTISTKERIKQIKAAIEKLERELAELQS